MAEPERRDARERPYWINLTSNAAGTNRYGWEQVDDTDPAFSTTLAADFTMSGTSAATGWPAYEINGRTDVPADGSVSVLAHLSASGQFWIFDASSAAGSSSSSSCSAFGWVAGLQTTECLTLAVVGAFGNCADIDTTQFLVLRWTGSAWVSDTTFAYDGGSGVASFVVTGGRPTLTIDGIDLVLECGGDGVITFAGGAGLCSGSPEQCNNYFRVTLACGCCPFDSYAGPGWYCVEDGGGDCVVVVEIVGDGDECAELVYCSGPFATEAEAIAACTPATVDTNCCADVPETLYLKNFNATFCAGASGSIPVYYDSGSGSWKTDAAGDAAAGCGPGDQPFAEVDCFELTPGVWRWRIRVQNAGCDDNADPGACSQPYATFAGLVTCTIGCASCTNPGGAVTLESTP